MATKLQLGLHRHHHHHHQKKKPTKRNEAAKWVRRFLNYLKSDSYLFGPSLNPPPPATAAVGFQPPKVSFPEVGMEFMVVRGRKSGKGFGRNVLEYLKSDSYLYGPLLCSRPTIPGYVRRSKKLAMEMLTRKATRKDIQSTVGKSNVTVDKEEDRFFDVVVLPPTTPERNRSTGQQQQKSVQHLRRRREASSHVVLRRSGRLSSSKTTVVSDQVT